MQATKKYYVKSGYVLEYPDKSFEAHCLAEDIPFVNYTKLSEDTLAFVVSKAAKQAIGENIIYGIRDGKRS